MRKRFAVRFMDWLRIEEKSTTWCWMMLVLEGRLIENLLNSSNKYLCLLGNIVGTIFAVSFVGMVLGILGYGVWEIGHLRFVSGFSFLLSLPGAFIAAMAIVYPIVRWVAPGVKYVAQNHCPLPRVYR